MEDALWLKQQSAHVAVRLKRLTPILSVTGCHLASAKTETYRENEGYFLMSSLSWPNDKAEGGASRPEIGS